MSFQEGNERRSIASHLLENDSKHDVSKISTNWFWCFIGAGDKTDSGE